MKMGESNTMKRFLNDNEKIEYIVIGIVIGCMIGFWLGLTVSQWWV